MTQGPPSTAQLTLHEQVLLLTYVPRRNRFGSETSAPALVGGAALAELAIRGYLAGASPDDHPAVTNPLEPPTEPVLRACFEDLLQPARVTTTEQWLTTAPQRLGLGDETFRQLAARGVVVVEERRFLALFARRRVVLRDADRLAALVAHLVGHLTGEGEPTDERTNALIALARAGDVLDHHLPTALRHEDTIRQRARRLEEALSPLLAGVLSSVRRRLMFLRHAGATQSVTLPGDS
jgi:hypothetical protein